MRRKVLDMDLYALFYERKDSELAIFLSDLLRDDGHSLPSIHRDVNTALINAAIAELVGRRRDDMVLSEVNYAISRNIIDPGRPVFSSPQKESFWQLFDGVDDVEISIFLADEIRDGCDKVATQGLLQWQMTALLALAAIEELQKRRKSNLLASVLKDLIIEKTLAPKEALFQIIGEELGQFSDFSEISENMLEWRRIALKPA